MPKYFYPQYSTEGKVKEPNLALEAGQGLYSAASSYMKGDMKGAISGVSSLFKTATGSTKKADDHAKRTRTSPADVVSELVFLWDFALMKPSRSLGAVVKTRRLGV